MEVIAWIIENRIAIQNAGEDTGLRSAEIAADRGTVLTGVPV
jgi:hypothetical protein